MNNRQEGFRIKGISVNVLEESEKNCMGTGVVRICQRTELCFRGCLFWAWAENGCSPPGLTCQYRALGLGLRFGREQTHKQQQQQQKNPNKPNNIWWSQAETVEMALPCPADDQNQIFKNCIEAGLLGGKRKEGRLLSPWKGTVENTTEVG